MLKVTEIARSFSKTFQEKEYEPFNVFASYKGELDGTETPEQIQIASDYLYSLAERDVRKITDMWDNRRADTKRRKEEKNLPF